jgi:lipopolysaccharide heptosyltransferase I
LSARILIVRLSALGDIVHAVPVLAALRRQDPAVEVDWLVEEAYAPVLGLVDGLRPRVVVRAERGPSPSPNVSGDCPRFASGPVGYARAIAYLRRQRYDVALDLQGLIKSAVWTRASGARRVIGFAREHLREPQAARLYREHVTPPHPAHVIQKNLAVAEHLGAAPAPEILPLRAGPTPALANAMRGLLEGAPYAVINPGAAWPNKRWPVQRFAALAEALLHQHGLVSVVTWGSAERALADQIVAMAGGAARLSPPTSVGELAALMQGAALVVSGDTGPLHIAAAVGAPVVGLYGPTWPERNGPWDPADEVISRADGCRCHHKRQCLIGAPCIETIGLDEVIAAAGRRLDRADAARQTAEGRRPKAEGTRQKAEGTRQNAEGLP